MAENEQDALYRLANLENSLYDMARELGATAGSLVAGKTPTTNTELAMANRSMVGLTLQDILDDKNPLYARAFLVGFKQSRDAALEPKK